MLFDEVDTVSEAVIDLRSDTVTRPSREMRMAMAQAEVGDDVIDRDPTCDRLQARIAEMLGKEDALFMPSGSMTNQIAVRIHCKPGDEFLCEAGCHIYNYEQAAFAQLSGLAARTVEGTHGVLDVAQLRGLIRPAQDHLVRTRLVCLENTHNRGAGRIQPHASVQAICAWARENDLRTHLDGARLFNAVVATGIPASDWAQHFDTVSVCFSKGLGAPVGSALVGSKAVIREARRHRKLFGGGMRQAGILAAGALYALEHNISRLADDHRNARRLADTVRRTPGLLLVPDQIDSNIVIFQVDAALGSAGDFAAALRERGVLVLAIGATQIRAVTHLDVDAAAIERAATIVAETAAGQQQSAVAGDGLRAASM
jgi:threonine aldolase